MSLEKVTDKNEIPDLINMDVSAATHLKADLKLRCIHAQDIIIANLHEDVSIHLILHLLKSYDPIAISLMKTTPQMSIRYCHVYFKTQEQAIQVERVCDRTVLFGKRLIVLRSYEFEKHIM